MTLQKQHISTRVGGGLLEGTDDFLVDAPNVLECENARFGSRGVVSKRYGHALLSATGAPSSASEVNTLFEHQGALGMLHAEGCYVLDEEEDEWRRTNECGPRPSRVLTDPLIRSNDSIAKVDMAVVGNLGCVVWQKAGRRIEPEIFYAFVDMTTQSILSGPTSMGTSGMRRAPRIAVFSSGTKLALIGLTGTGYGSPPDPTGDVHYATYTLAAGTYAFSASAIITGATNQSLPLNIATDGGTTFYAVSQKGANTEAYKCSSAGASGTSGVFAGFHAYASIVHTNGNLVSIDADASGGTYRIHRVDAGDLVTGSTVSLIGAPYMTGGFPSAGGLRATLVQDPGSSDPDDMVAAISAYGLSWDTHGTDIISIFGVDYSVNTSGFVHSMSVCGKAAYVSGLESGVVIPLAHQVESDDQHEHVDPATGLATGFFEDEETISRPYGLLCVPCLNAADEYTVAVRGRFLQDKVSAGGTAAELPTLSVVDGEVIFPETVLVGFVSEDDPQLNRGGVDLVRAHVDATPAQRSATAQSLRIFGGGCGCTTYDGEQLAEIPEGISTLHLLRDTDTSIDLANITGIAPPDSGGGAGHEDEFVFRLVPRWTDAQGNVRRGAPSPRLIVNADDVGSTNFGVRPDAFGPEILFPPPFPTAINGDRGLLFEVEVYVSNFASPTEHWLAATVTPRENPTYENCYSITFTWQLLYAFNDTAVGSHIFALTYGGYLPLGSAPAGLAKSTARLYTDTELEARPAPPLLDLVSTQSRLWALSAENRLEVLPTKPLLAGYGPEFASELAIPVPHEGGDCVGLGALGDKVVVFKQRQTYTIFGEPGSAAGTGSTVRRPILVSPDVGCKNVHSIVHGPFGVAWQSERGFEAMSPSGEITFVGDAVKDSLGELVVTSAVLVPSQSEVRWSLDSTGSDYGTGRALVWNYRVNAWSLWTSFFCVHACVRDGVYHRAIPSVGVYAETPGAWALADFNMKVVTSWLRFADLQGFQRVWRALLLLRHYTGRVQVKCVFDYDDAFKDTREWTEAEVVALTSTARAQLSFSPLYQKCEALKIEITERATVSGGEGVAPTVGRGIELVGVDFLVGRKRGSFRHRMADAAKK